MTDRVPGAPGQYSMTVDPAEAQKILTGETVTVTLTRNDQPIVEGTPYNKESVLPDDLAALVCPGISDPTPADAFWGLLAQRYTVILGSANWANNQQTVSVPGVTEDPYATDVYVSPDMADSNYKAYNSSGVRPYAQRNGAVVFKCDTVPSTNITVNIAVRV